MATATRPRRPRAAAQPEVKNVTSSRGGAKVHAAKSYTDDMPYPACRNGNQTRRHMRYVHTTAAVTCDRCLEGIAEQERANAGARAARENNRSPRASRSQRNGARQEQATAQAREIIKDETDKVLAKRDEQWASERKPDVSDEDYALAVQVRTLRASGGAWWAIAHAMGLKGSGPSVKEGKTGAAHARRLWEKAWGKTYSDTSVPRETKAIKAERAATQPGKPYFAHDAQEMQIIAAVKGKTIEWVARVGNDPASAVHTVLSATVSGLHRIKVVEGKLGRVLVFFELPEPGSRVSGPQRSVYIDRIEKVSL